MDKKRLLDNYIFDERTRYEAHTLHYHPQGTEPIQLGGIMGAAVLAALLVDTDEGDARGIAIDTPAQRKEFFQQYEREVRRDNGGLFKSEVNALSQSYQELAGDEYLLRQMCINDRIFDLAVGMIVEYMKQLVEEMVYETIYDRCPWEGPFAQWLYKAAFWETRRQQLLSIHWLDAVEVYALSEELEQMPDWDITPAEQPTFAFDGFTPQQIMETYFRWLWTAVQAETSVYPDAQKRQADLQPEILEQETNYDFLKPELKNLAPEGINLFRLWMRQWNEFIRQKLATPEEEAFPKPVKKSGFKQEIFADNVLPCPPKNSYVKVCDYIEERCEYDEKFHTYYTTHKRVELCDQLTELFGWYVDPGFLGSRINYRKKHKK